MSSILQLISGPRNVSTALMYSFHQRKDTHCLDEPYYACYLKENNKIHPARTQILQVQSTDRSQVYQQITELALESPYLFIKNMAHHLTAADLYLQTNWRHCFLIRHPALILQSYAKVIQQPSSADIGLQQQRKWYDLLKEKNQSITIIDSSDFLTDPRANLIKLCEQLNIPFDSAMLSWPPGPKSIDGIWAPYWYDQAHRSIGFRQPKDQKSINLPPYLNQILEESLVDYHYLKSKIDDA